MCLCNEGTGVRRFRSREFSVTPAATTIGFACASHGKRQAKHSNIINIIRLIFVAKRPVKLTPEFLLSASATSGRRRTAGKPVTTRGHATSEAVHCVSLWRARKAATFARFPQRAIEHHRRSCPTGVRKILPHCGLPQMRSRARSAGLPNSSIASRATRPNADRTGSRKPSTIVSVAGSRLGREFQRRIAALIEAISSNAGLFPATIVDTARAMASRKFNAAR